MNHHLPYWLALHHLPMSRRKMLCLLEHFSTPEQLFRAHKEELLLIGASMAEIQAIQCPNWKVIETELAWANKPYHAILSLQDDSYPPLLKQTADPPFILYVKGDQTVLSRKQLAMVGSRKASPTGIKNAEQFAYHLSLAGLVITSGFALGIDTASHRGALAAKRVTIGVFGTGLNHIYPAINRKLVQEVLDHQGALLSEFPLDAPPKAIHFPLRNRIIAGLSLGVLVVEAARKSGSLITAHHALEYGREVFAIPGSIHHLTSRGCHYLIKQGAKLVECMEDILEELNGFKGVLQSKNKQPPIDQSLPMDFSKQEKDLFEQIGYEIIPIDMIILRTGLTRSEVSSILLSLELRGYIQTVSGGYVRID
ncbi:MAG: DNA protecting protein DprA [Gammaproteobacteria bacterium RIFCSPHIGHO2_12_FULL_37_34]|nr:MAG: DNA protecting protein DprA [Gammaproteobacteria bacterium RIFCSPHIGHO2_12_FULL_37_34]